MVVIPNRWASFALALALCSPWGTASARPEGVLVLRYSVQETDLAPVEREHLSQEVRSPTHRGSVVLIQGFACDLGGYEISQEIAAKRAERVRHVFLEAGWEGPAVFLSKPVVLAGEPRPPNRRVEIRFFPNLEKLRAAKLEADRKGLNAGRSFLQGGVDSADAGRRGFYAAGTILAGLVILVVLVLILWLARQRDKRSRDDHLLNDEEASALEVLTGGSIGPLVVHEKEIELVGRGKMAKKQAKQHRQVRINPISIRSAVERQYEEKTLSQLVQEPVHALQGLTPRHSRMLEEAFGIKTIEDLAKLKYFEIAKAMVILSRYEK